MIRIESLVYLGFLDTLLRAITSLVWRPSVRFTPGFASAKCGGIRGGKELYDE